MMDWIAILSTLKSLFILRNLAAAVIHFKLFRSVSSLIIIFQIEMASERMTELEMLWIPF